MTTAHDIAASALRYWSVQDVESTIAFMDPDVVYHLNIDRELVPLGGETRGIDDLRDAYFGLLAEWDYLKYEPKILGDDGHTVRATVDFVFRHRISGNDLDGTYRLVIEIVDGLITRIDEFHDRAMVEAFMALSTAGRRTPVRPAM